VSQYQLDGILVPVLRIDGPVPRQAMRDGLQEPSCRILSGARVKRLVLLPKVQTRRPNFDRLKEQYLEEVVAHVNVHINLWRPYALHLAPRAKRLVVIVRTCGNTNSSASLRRGGNQNDGNQTCSFERDGLRHSRIVYSITVGTVD
jgi:hypothetical protein